MFWRATISAAAVLGGVVLATPLAAQTQATVASVPAVAVPAVETADTSWPVIVPRLATYSAAQKSSINAMLQRYCTPDASPSRSELQDRIRAILTPEQEIAALRYWIPQDLQRDILSMQNDLVTHASPAPREQLDACGRVQKVPA